MPSTPPSPQRRQEVLPATLGRAAVFAVLLIAGCGGAGDPAQIPPQDPDVVAAGAELYASRCASCHGADVDGTDQGPSFLSPVYRPARHAEGAFLLAVRVGVRAHHWNFGDMPPIDGLQDDEIEAITAFVRETQRTRGFGDS